MPTPVLLAELTTLRLGGPAPDLVTATTPAEVAEALGSLDAAGGALVLGGGSNLVVADRGIDVPVLRIAIPGVAVADHGDHALVTIGAGLEWDGVVQQLTAAGYAELALLAGIPGSVGATPVQNVGAYGTEISDVLTSVTLYDRVARRIRSVPAAELGLGYRSSTMRGTDTAVVLDVTFRLRVGPTTVRYAELARTLGVPPGDTAPPQRVREAVLELRRGKGMVLDPADPDTRSAGSFFTNPILTATDAARVEGAVRARFGNDVACPAYPGDGGVKLSAAWLIERAGFGKGHPGPGGRVAVSGKHSLALTNRGSGTTADLLELAREIRDGVAAVFSVTLHPEPVLVGVSMAADPATPRGTHTDPTSGPLS